MAYIYEQNIDDELNMTLSDTFSKNYAVDARITKAVDLMQQNFKCCGAIRFEEYRESVWLRSNRIDLIVGREGRKVPDSCCVTMKKLCGVSDHPSNIPYTVSRRSDKIFNVKIQENFRKLRIQKILKENKNPGNFRKMKNLGNFTKKFRKIQEFLRKIKNPENFKKNQENFDCKKFNRKINPEKF